MLTLSYAGHQAILPPNSMIIVKDATEEDYLSLANEDLKIEFDGACLYIHSPATKRRERVVYKLLQLFNQYFLDHPTEGEAIGSRFALKLPNRKRPEPDVVVVPFGEVGEDDSVFEGLPRLIVEILSPSTRDHDLGPKLTWYQEARVPELWYIDLDAQSVKVWMLNPESEEYEAKTISAGEIESNILPQFSLSIEDLLKE
ncbi:MAG TPA: Uma2 family endonuclease [Candidatus Lokiarchaeia archaeon]|nr:Uma2 family endonuclease [Candidatus Lokiarchaeia archaeon]